MDGRRAVDADERSVAHRRTEGDVCVGSRTKAARVGSMMRVLVAEDGQPDPRTPSASMSSSSSYGARFEPRTPLRLAVRNVGRRKEARIEAIRHDMYWGRYTESGANALSFARRVGRTRSASSSVIAVSWLGRRSSAAVSSIPRRRAEEVNLAVRIDELQMRPRTVRADRYGHMIGEIATVEPACRASRRTCRSARERRRHARCPSP